MVALNTDIFNEKHPAYDANGNITAYVSNDAVVATYEYSPFGKVTEHTGQDFDYQFSTKMFDAETGLSYYGLRYLDTNTSRWLSRDPIAENGGINLYGFVGNDAVNSVDYLGMEEIEVDAYNGSGAYSKVTVDVEFEFDETNAKHKEYLQKVKGVLNEVYKMTSFVASIDENNTIPPNKMKEEDFKKNIAEISARFKKDTK